LKRKHEAFEVCGKKQTRLKAFLGSAAFTDSIVPVSAFDRIAKASTHNNSTTIRTKGEKKKGIYTPDRQQQW